MPERDVWDTILDEAEGNVWSTGEIIERYDLDMDDEELIEKLLDLNFEQCSECGEWHHSGEMECPEGSVLCAACYDPNYDADEEIDDDA